MAGFLIEEIDRDTPRVALPRPEVQIIVRFGPSAHSGLDAYAFGVQRTVRRKLIRRGQRAVTAHLHLGASPAMLGLPACALAGSVVPLDELWGSPAVERFLDRLAGVSDTVDAVGILEAVIGERLACATEREFELPLAREAAQRLESASVAAVAADLGVSERHLRRVFRATVGMSPKQFARLARFRRAVGTARENSRLTWADVAATAGYYDQPHLIADFHAIAGASPRALLGELGSD